jgi:methylphosphotriester-DNA--protein-cysteine methyltransferase
MAAVAGLPAHTLERTCRRHFGFPPRLLLRRQRFMRSLSQYMLDPSLKWIGAIDSHYHDQAQFVRDFHAFMDMSPSEYAARPHPVLGAVMRARQDAAGAAVQALHRPNGAAEPR